ncbi:DsbA family oxidoreductase [Paraburkholderia susongensis]|uniref:Predicted dithiol-disulfide isomerase, DsbA family n=1 Tax=Paraburkholderia susongensis TaxID=1515439 RepID=A0A1X7M2M8_9BURK|nr:DsbA family oxidoreductase [Paraburkholderia susongensis]SMG60436.1 Predicted dithiol-disulfide isomerase, DsbA family [Paraburkholderia susongensis]
MEPLEIRITHDFICPWCWIGETKLEEAIAAEGASENVKYVFVPYELNPDMPQEGRDRKAYRTAKFGSWARSQAMDAHVADEGRLHGLSFDYEKVKRTPNTMAAHRLVWFAQHEGRDARALVHAIFRAYFTEGRDIGDRGVLTDIAASVGLDRARVNELFASQDGYAQVRKLEAASALASIHAVPYVKLGSEVVSGAQPVPVFRRALRVAMNGDAEPRIAAS